MNVTKYDFEMTCYRVSDNNPKLTCEKTDYGHGCSPLQMEAIQFVVPGLPYPGYDQDTLKLFHKLKTSVNIRVRQDVLRTSLPADEIIKADMAIKSGNLRAYSYLSSIDDYVSASTYKDACEQNGIKYDDICRGEEVKKISKISIELQEDLVDISVKEGFAITMPDKYKRRYIIPRSAVFTGQGTVRIHKEMFAILISTVRDRLEERAEQWHSERIEKLF